jgi:hypothetical protein
MEERFPPDSLDIIHSIFAEELQKEKDPGCDKNRSRVIEAEHYLSDGKTIWVSMNTSFIRDKNGNPFGIQGVARDITERKRADQEHKKNSVPVHPNSENGICRSIGWRCRSRLQQHAACDFGLC